MDNGMQELAALQQQYAAAQERKRKRIKKIILGILVFAVIMTPICVYLFKPIHLIAEDLDLEAVEKDGIIYIYATWAEGGTIYARTGGGSTLDEDVKRVSYYIDYENKIDYVDCHFRLEACRWDLLVHPKRDYIFTEKYYPDGRSVATIYESHRVIDENGTAYQMSSRCARLFYDDPDGTAVLVWECEGIPK
ncbi:MAG: hypothetical protein IJX64_06350 [Clostridia bacterium]|nr:hypothetical protein [Clostridia bacterium]